MKAQLVAGRILLIYQMPKAGSQTIEATLKHCFLPHQIHRFHFLRSALAEPWASQQMEFMSKMSRALRVRKLLRACGLTIPKIEVITGLREPIGAMLSAVFENYYHFFSQGEPVKVSKYRDILLKPDAMNLVQQWFDCELKPFTGIDVFKKPFPWDQGYAIYENRFSRLLLYRYEALGKVSDILREFLSCDVPAVINRNLSSSKEYSEAYRQVKEHLRLPADWVAKQCNSRMMRHFYSEQERQDLQLKWAQTEKERVPSRTTRSIPLPATLAS
jgi:hypothetical protein